MKNLLAAIILLVSTYSVQAQAVKYSNEFLALGVGARALAMGNSVIASEKDIFSSYWNPTGLLDMRSDARLGFMHSEHFSGIANHDYGGVAIKLDSGKHVFGLSLIRLGIDGIPYTLNLREPDGSINFDNISEFSAADYAIYISYARKLSDRLYIGGNAKVIRRKVGSFAGAWGFGLDLAAKYKLKDWIFAVNVRDITTTFNGWSYDFTEKEKEVFTETGNDLPQNGLEVTLPKILLGVAYHKNFKKFEFTAEADIDISTDGKRNVLVRTNAVSFDPHIGLEVGFAEIIYARFGINNIQQETNDDKEKKYTVQPNVGIGLQFRTINIDQGIKTTITIIRNDSFYSHVISASIGFNKKPK